MKEDHRKQNISHFGDTQVEQYDYEANMDEPLNSNSLLILFVDVFRYVYK